MKNLKNKKGFTLIELIVVIAILGILALFLVPQFTGYSQDAKRQVNEANTRSVVTAIEAAIAESEYKDAIANAGDVITQAKTKLGDAYKLAITYTFDTDFTKPVTIKYGSCTYTVKTAEFSGCDKD